MKYNGEYLDLHCGGVDNASRTTPTRLRSPKATLAMHVPAVVPCTSPEYLDRKNVEIKR